MQVFQRVGQAMYAAAAAGRGEAPTAGAPGDDGRRRIAEQPSRRRRRRGRDRRRRGCLVVAPRGRRPTTPADRGHGQAPGPRTTRRRAVPADQAGRRRRVQEARRPDGADVDEPTSTRARAEAAEYRDHLRRLQAEFDNYRKRVLKEQTDAVERAAEPVVRRLLEVLDDFELALMSANEQAGLRPVPAGRRARVREARRHAAGRGTGADRGAGQAVRSRAARGADADGRGRRRAWSWPTCCGPGTR